jgi:uncharacterized protein YjbI with pentapeptide repeats
MSETMNPEQLERRWLSPVAHGFATLISERGRPGNGFVVSESPFGFVSGNGLLDLRCLSLPNKAELRDVAFRNADLSAARFNGARVERCIFENVLFDETSWENVSDHGNTFAACSFIKTIFRGAILGYKGSHFHGCKFTEASFEYAQFIRPEFDDCTFKDCRYGGVDFNASSFERCEFSGEVRGVWFNGEFALPSQRERFGPPKPNRMLDVSFAHATLIEVSFGNNCDLSSVIPPSDSDHLFIPDWENCLIKLQATVQNWTSDERAAGEMFCKTHLIGAWAQDSYIVSFLDLMQFYGTAAPKLWESLGACQSGR